MNTFQPSFNLRQLAWHLIFMYIIFSQVSLFRNLFYPFYWHLVLHFLLFATKSQPPFIIDTIMYASKLAKNAIAFERHTQKLFNQAERSLGPSHIYLLLCVLTVDSPLARCCLAFTFLPFCLHTESVHKWGIFIPLKLTESWNRWGNMGNIWFPGR